IWDLRYFYTPSLVTQKSTVESWDCREITSDQTITGIRYISECNNQSTLNRVERRLHLLINTSLGMGIS
ncbi:hypothetical protein PENTCL1PPCAC_12745, partial [Pristionchus entomophagus]